MKIRDHLEKKQIKQTKHKEEILTESEIKDLMGVHRDTYKRGKGGAFRKR
ncbi:hypothetical protein [Oceanobacillus salinisoli]|nr:hypothetical protein [Oceanobacillus salinisoli]